jgi:ATP-dependent RNA helicase DDX56/DBP9
MKSLPKICQGFLMSATLSPELNDLKKVVLHSPAVLKLEEETERKQSRKDGLLTQFYLALPKKDKSLVLYVFLKVG